MSLGLVIICLSAVVPAAGGGATAPSTEEPLAGERATAEALFEEGLRLAATNDRADTEVARRRFTAALAIWQRLGDTAAQSRVTEHLAAAALRLDEAETGLELAEEALELARASGDRAAEAAATRTRGRALRRVGRNAAAIEALQAAAQAFRELGQSADLAAALNSIGLALQEAGRCPEAIPLLEESVALSRAQADAYGAANALNSLGLCLKTLGRLDDALARYQQALAAGDQDEELWIAVASNLGALHRLRGEYQPALDLHLEALSIAEDRGELSSEAKIRQKLGTAYLDLGRVDEARGTYTRARDLFLTLGDSVGAAEAGRNLGWTELLLGRREEALVAFRAALEAGGDLPPPDSRAATLYAVAYAELEAGDARAARAPLELALELARQSGDEVRTAAILGLLGTADAALGDPARAREELDSALALARALGDPDLAARTLADLAQLDARRGDLEAARDRLREALAITQRSRTGVKDPDYRATFFARRRDIADRYVAALADLAIERPGQGWEGEALAASEAARARSLAELLHERRIEVAIAPDLERRQRLLDARLSWLQGELITLQTGGRAGPSKEDRERELAEVGREADELKAEIRSGYPRWADLRYPEPLAPAAIQSRLEPRTALLEYAIGEERSHLFVVTRESLALLPLAVSAGDLASAVSELRAALLDRGRRGLAVYAPTAARLYGQLILPAAPLLAAADHIIVVPDRALHVLPFEALLSTAPGVLDPAEMPYLLRRWSVSYAPSASVLAGLAAPSRATPGPELVAFADAVYPLEATASAATASRPRPAALRSAPSEQPWALPRLEQSAAEARGIAALFAPDRVVLYLREEAREENLKGDGRVASARLVHLASHGRLDEDRPDDSGLVLSRLPGSAEDGVLRVHEIFQLRLSAELVTLSACETGLGRDVSGEGLVGLARSFLYAGARRLAVSLWPVSDSSTSALMVGFYRRLRDGEAVARSLQAAKLALVEEGGPWSHPYHWASFILIGEQGPLAPAAP